MNRYQRMPNTTRSGEPFSQRIVDEVWNKAQRTSTPGVARDACNATIMRTSYGTTSQFGWEVDHIVPVSQGGTDDLSNLQPLHWRNNRRKGDSRDTLSSCIVTN